MWTIDIDNIENIVINDFNSELINLYKVVKNKPDDLIKSVSRHQNSEEYYYKIRALDREENFHRKHSVTRASRFIYLNKAAFNGLYRVNKSGHHNVPYNHRKYLSFLDETNIKVCSHFLQNVTILNDDFEIIRSAIDRNSFVYLDPPYAPISDTSSFTIYTNNGFDWNTQVRLKEFCDYVDSVGAKFMASNSASPFIYSLYSGYKIDEVQANRIVNSHSNKRGKISELIIRNYE